MRLEIASQVSEIPARSWNALQGTGNPFLSHEFLSALETSACVCPKTGWWPQHFLVYDGDQLLAAAPAYIKNHSYGEYIFDWAWANAYLRAGQPYYPKLTFAVPFTPTTGQRLLIKEEANKPELVRTIAEAARAVANKQGLSSVHWLFVEEKEQELLVNSEYIARSGFQYHWHNNHYRDFEQFLATMSSRKRKKIRQERRYVQEQGISIEYVTGSQLNGHHWHTFFRFYQNTIRNHGAIQYLNAPFFQTIGKTMADRVLMVLAKKENQTVAAALNFFSSDSLYGRYWGTDEFHSGLHFETCYYAPIEFCISEGLGRFEAGAQGSHKLSRGFLPQNIYSAHWLNQNSFGKAIEEYVEYERRGLIREMSELQDHSPFRQTD